MDSIETLSQVLCATTLMLWVLIATLSRSDESENRAQWAMVVLSLSAMFSLIYLDVLGGSLWGSTYLPKPLAVLCLAFAFLARLNIKGRNLSQGMNPHQIMKQNQEAEEE
ncbi:MAG: hypothetical protein OSB33_04605 [Candidatus Poseidoniales archaeon]|nr:hypothetical protein [Candidatus Poseidoniales archaeon]